MFLERYGLQNNPFAGDRERPFLESGAARELAGKLQRAAVGQIQCLVISGAAGVGKTTAVRRGLSYFEGWFQSWIDNPIADSRDLLVRLLSDVGLGPVEAETAELRNILEMFLRHQAARERPGLLVVDGLNEPAAELLSELQWLVNLRLRGRPLIRMVLITRSDELAFRMLPSAGHRVGDLHQHQAFHGFSLEDTREYIRDCLYGADCYEAEQLAPDAAVELIQGFSGGVPGKVDRLCAVALNALAENSSPVGRRPGLSKSLITNAAEMLRFEYDEAVVTGQDEPLSREHIQEHDQGSSSVSAARLLVASGDQIIAEIILNRSRMVLGRDANCDISLNSRYASRYQNLFMHTDEGWLMIDLNSTNGSFVNGRRVREHVLQDGDVIALGAHQLRFLGGSASVVIAEPTPIAGGSGRLPAATAPGGRERAVGNLSGA